MAEMVDPAQDRPVAARQRHFYYWIGPTLVTGALILMYFSGVPWLQDVVVPRGLGRELGAPENIQLLIILGMIVVSVQGIRRKKWKWERAAFAWAILTSLFMLLEEMDYGVHFMNAIDVTLPWEQPNFTNIHNVGEGTDMFKNINAMAIVLLFLVLPLVTWKMRQPWVRYVTPERYAIGTLICMTLTTQIALYLAYHTELPHKGLEGNISEFQEIFLYYIWFLHLFEIVHKRVTPALRGGASGE